VAKTQTTSPLAAGLDLHLDTRTGKVRAGLERALREAVTSGRLEPGVRLPSSRALAADLGIARATVTEAYGQLVAEGWLTARQGSGTLVAGTVTDAAVRAAHTVAHTVVGAAAVHPPIPRRRRTAGHHRCAHPAHPGRTSAPATPM
jgi:GntR family transcriptional regulator/MocR family aminotransferase